MDFGDGQMGHGRGKMRGDEGEGKEVTEGEEKGDSERKRDQ